MQRTSFAGMARAAAAQGRRVVTRLVRLALAVLVVAVLGFAGAVTATSATSGQSAIGTLPANGQIVFGLFDKSVDDTLVYTVDPDGSHLKKVVPEPLECMTWSPDGTWIVTCGRGGPHPAAALLIDPDTGAERAVPRRYPKLNLACPVMSPDGKRLACGQFDNAVPPSRNGIYTIRVSDGRGLQRVTSYPGGSDETGSYSPNGRWLVFGHDEPNDRRSLRVVRTDGTRMHALTAAGNLLSSSGDWSPEGNEVVFSRHVNAKVHSTLWLIHANGSGLRQIHVEGKPHFCGGAIADPATRGCTDPHWSPDGRQIVFRRDAAHDNGNIFTVNVDGTDLQQVTARLHTDVAFPDWGTHPLAGQ